MNENLHLKIAAVLKEMMRKKGLSYNKLSKLSGISASTLKSYSNNISPRSMVQVKRLAQVLGISLHYLLFAEEESGHIPTKVDDIATNPSFSSWAKVTIEIPPNKDNQS